MGLKQVELAAQGGVSRATQLSYEAGTTAPSTEYLLKVQDAGVDVPFVLFGHPASELEGRISPASNTDWGLVQQAYEHVEFFCLRAAPQCPSHYRWQLVAHMYRYLQVRAAEGHERVADKTAQEEIASTWSSYARS